MDIAAVVLRDDDNNITVRTLSQAVSVPKEFVDEACRVTAEDYELRSTGFSSTVGLVLSNIGLPPPSPPSTNACTVSDYHS